MSVIENSSPSVEMKCKTDKRVPHAEFSGLSAGMTCYKTTGLHNESIDCV